jgi:hypothetical protein
LFKFFRNIGKINKVWSLLNEKYFISLDGKIGNTVLKIQENPMTGNQLIVQTENENVKTILKDNEPQIISDLNNELGMNFLGIKII